jgi:hypothetical protein
MTHFFIYLKMTTTATYKRHSTLRYSFTMCSTVKQSTRFGETFSYYSNFGFIDVNDEELFEYSNLQDVLFVEFEDGIRVRLYCSFERGEDIAIVRDVDARVRPSTSKLSESKLQVIDVLLREQSVSKSLRRDFYELLEKWKL